MKKILLSTAIAVLIISSCTKENQTPSYLYEEGELKIEARYPGSITKVTATAFEADDKIGLWAASYEGVTPPPLQISGNWINNSAMTTADGMNWTAAKRIYWAEGLMDIYGYYPYIETPTSISEHPWSVQLDQNTVGDANTLGGYEASDFLWAKDAAAQQADGSATLDFKHSCTRLVVKLVKGADYTGVWPDASELYLHNTVPTATIDFTTGAVTKWMYGEPATIKTHRVDDETFEVIVVPQRIDSRRPLLEYIANGISYLYEGTFNFKPGISYTINLTINANPDQIHIDITPGTGTDQAVGHPSGVQASPAILKHYEPPWESGAY